MDKAGFYNFCSSLEQTAIKLEGCKEISDGLAMATTDNAINDMALWGLGAFMQAILGELKKRSGNRF